MRSDDARAAIDRFDKQLGHTNWYLIFEDESIRSQYEQLEDFDRWYITNMMLGERSPLLWFFLRRADSAVRRPSERDLCDGFLSTRFVRSHAYIRTYVQEKDGRYATLRNANDYPGTISDPVLRAALASDGTASMKSVLNDLGHPLSFAAVNDTRLRLTTLANPFLEAVA